MSAAPRARLLRLLAATDATLLGEDDTPTAVERFCREAAVAPRPAAVCLWPEAVVAARRALDAAGATAVPVAAVVNFPDGSADAARALSETRRALAAGAGEIDLVYPWRAHRDGDREAGPRMLARCREACAGRPLKAILETGELGDPGLIRELGSMALAAGADFLKTSTGRARVGATPAAAAAILDCIREAGRGGLKVSGGIRTVAEAEPYLALADGAMGEGWAAPARFRIGSSALLAALRAELAATAAG